MAGLCKAVQQILWRCHVTSCLQVKSEELGGCIARWSSKADGELGTGPAEAALGGIAMETAYSPSHSTML